ncbi:MAG: hypothetical protein GXP26_02900 [Planctomycetes bacterium]|nr:hypothetical protein [Planctomycetota bacterium]
MVARRVVFFVPTFVVCLALLATEAFDSRAADRPNHASPSDLAAGRMMDSLFDFEKPSSKQLANNHGTGRRRFSSRGTALEGKLVRNPDRGDGAPSFALVDHYGGVLRYIEPIDRIDLSQYLGQTVGVRRDTGDTLLASQLALPNASPRQWSGGVQLADFQEVVPQGEIVEGSILMPEGQEPPIYLDEGLNFGDCSECGSYNRRGTYDDGCVSCGSGVGCGSGCGRSPNWLRPYTTAQFDAELLLFAVSDSEAEVNDTQNNLNAGFRLTFNRVNEQGQIFRVRYFNFASTLEGGGNRYEMEEIDTEIGRRFTLGGGLQGEFTGGIRFADFDERNGLDYDATFGPLVGLQLRGRKLRLLRCTSFANMRHSWQFGNGGVSGVDAPGTFNISEVQLGLEWRRQSRLGTLVLRTALEAQYWSGVQDDDTEDIGLYGSATSFGLAF